MVHIIYFNTDQLNSSDIGNKLESLNCDTFKIKDGMLVCSSDKSPKELYESLGSLVDKKNIFIAELSNCGQYYWGYMGSRLWEWLKKQESLPIPTDIQS